MKIEEGFEMLAHPLRTRIIEKLAENGPMVVQGLSVELRTGMGVISHHLRLMSRVGLLYRIRKGKFRVYGINKKTFEVLGYWLDKILEKETENEA